MYRVIYSDDKEINDRYKGERDEVLPVPQKKILEVIDKLRIEDKIGDRYLTCGGLVEKSSLGDKSFLIHISASIMGSLDFEIRHDLRKYRYGEDLNSS